MTKLYLDSASLTQKANDLEELNNRFLALVGNLNDREEVLAGMWEGPAHDEFRKAYHSDSVQMKNFYNAIVVYLTVLRQIISEYEKIEIINSERARTRTR